MHSSECPEVSSAAWTSVRCGFVAEVTAVPDGIASNMKVTTLAGNTEARHLVIMQFGAKVSGPPFVPLTFPNK